MDRFKQEFMPFVERTSELIEATMNGDVLSEPYLDENVIWIAQNGAVYIDKSNVNVYLSDAKKRLGTTYDLDVSFIKELSPDCLSVTGRVSFGKHHHTFEEMDVCFHASWIRDHEDWKVKHIATSSEKRIFRGESANTESDFDLGLLYDRMPAGIVGCENNPTLSVRMMNPIILSLLGYEDLDELKENMGASLFALVHPDDLQKIRDFTQLIRSDGSREILTIRVRKRDFSYAWIQMTGSMFRSDMLVLLCMDYSRQHDHNAELSQKTKDASARERDYRKVLENLPGGFWLSGVSSSTQVDYVSDSLCQLTGYTSKEILDDMHGVFTELIVPEDRKQFEQTTIRMMQYPYTTHSTYRLKAKDGREIPVMDIAQSVRSDDGKLNIYAMVQEMAPFMNDLTIGASQIESRLNQLMHNMPFGLCVYRYQGGQLKAEYVNGYFTQMFGFDESEYAELSDNQVFPLMFNEDVPELESALEAMQNGAATGTGRGRMHGKEGMIWVEYHLFLLGRSEDGSITLASYYQDVTGEMTEEQEDRAKVEIRTFGYFSVSVDGKAVHFRSEKAKELLAVLVNYRGAFASQGALISCLWEDEPVN
ncbi:MAG: PAS domain-containing protein, partial [Lachnospiraceae bacterium]|nr:PAS domain-containing protein [Lachnospiraceae bacterium]